MLLPLFTTVHIFPFVLKNRSYTQHQFCKTSLLDGEPGAHPVAFSSQPSPPLQRLLLSTARRLCSEPPRSPSTAMCPCLAQSSEPFLRALVPFVPSIVEYCAGPARITRYVQRPVCTSVVHGCHLCKTALPLGRASHTCHIVGCKS